MRTGVVMVSPETRLFCRLDGLTPQAREQQRLKALAEMGVLEAETVPVFEEATQTAARYLETPICILGVMAQDRQLLKSAVGLSRVGLMNELATSRCLPRSEAFCTYVVDSHQVLAIPDTLTHPVFANSLLFGHYGIRSYLGAPLITADGYCLGTLAVMDVVPRIFTTKDIDFLELTARWALSEYERNRLFTKERKASVNLISKSAVNLPLPASDFTMGSQDDKYDVGMGSGGKQISPNFIKLKLLSSLAQELRTPLTSVMGMASVLGREVYGPLTTKQKEYLEIIHHSGQHLVELVDEISALGILDEGGLKLQISSVDIEMLCQQAINSLFQVAKQRQQKIRLSVEPTYRIWSLDKDKVRQILYYLVFSVIQSSEAGGVVRIHVSRKSEKLNISVWVSHPWLGDGLPQIEFYSTASVAALDNGLEATLNRDYEIDEEPQISYLSSANQMSSSSMSAALAIVEELTQLSEGNNSRESLGLLLSCQLAEIHGGQISVQGSAESGYRYVVSLPQLATSEDF